MNLSTSAPRRVRIAASVAGMAAASALLLSGCSNPIEDLVQGSIENGVEQVIEDSTGADVNVDTGGGASLPDGWPSELPLPAGDPQFSMGAQDGFQATFEISDAAQGEAIKDELLNEGYEMTGESDMGVMKTWILTGPEWQVSLALVIPEDDSAASLTYLVTPATE